MTTSFYIWLKMNAFKTLYPFTVIDRNKLDHKIQNQESVSAFKNQTLKFFRLNPNGTMYIYYVQSLRN